MGGTPERKAKMDAVELIKQWNSVKGIRHSYKGSDGQPTYLARQIQGMIDRDGEDVVVKWIYSKLNDPSLPSNDMNKVVGRSLEYLNFVEKNKEEKRRKEEEAKAAEAAAPMGNSQVLQVLSQELVKLLGSEISGNIEKKIDEYCEGKTLIKAVSIDSMPKKKLDAMTHEKFESVLKFVAADEPVMLVGPAGTGKNVIVKQVADALGLDFYFSNAVTQEYKLTGFVDANGNYQKTQFYDAFTKGGLFLIDEIDASVPEVLVILNAAIANRYFDFPGVGRVDANPNFRVVANANTFGTGASMEYSGRYQLDAASLNRFAMVKVGYDRRVEELSAGGNQNILDFCREFRRVSEKNGLRVVVSYRDIGRLHKMVDLAGMEVREAIETCLVKGLEKDSVNMIWSGMSDKVAWKKYLKELL